ncbi:MAG: Gfo/Idh/MocA family oxidoreductase [bacterium]|nr:Gfo/Idh/MocA family oxidoreductase [bacterium]
MYNRELNIAIIGTGFGAKVHAPGWSSVPGVRVTALAGRDFAKTKSIATVNSIPRVFSSWQKAVTDSDIDIVSIATPPHLQIAIALAALRNNKSVLLEKPAGTGLKEITELARVAKKSPGQVALDFEFRHIPHFIRLKHLLAVASIGQIRYCQVNWITGGRADKNIPLNWANYKKFGGGVLLNYGSHVIDYLEWLLGPMTAVSADLKIIKKDTSADRPDAEDFCHFYALFANGVMAGTVITNVVHGGSGHSIEIYGDKGTLKLSNHDLFDPIRGFTLTKIDTKNKAKIIKIKTFPKNMDGRVYPFAELAKNFVQAIKDKKPFAPSLSTGTRAHQVMAAIRRSAKTKKWIKI